VLSAWLVLGEEIGWPHIAGIALVLAGIILVAKGRGHQQQRPRILPGPLHEVG
jgi:drug/metabolite transporter (DMT)-like permease